MSVFSPRGVLGVIGAIFALIAIYLILVHFGGADSLLKTLSTGSIGLITTLQGRP